MGAAPDGPLRLIFLVWGLALLKAMRLIVRYARSPLSPRIALLTARNTGPAKLAQKSPGFRLGLSTSAIARLLAEIWRLLPSSNGWRRPKSVTGRGRLGDLRSRRWWD